jgi:hypothetical protein
MGLPSIALAQAPPLPPPPPPNYGAPPVYTQPGYPPGYPPPQGYPQPQAYPPPPAYAPPPAYYQPAGPKTMDWEEGDPVPAGYHVKTRARLGLVIGGAVTFGVLYLTSAFVGVVGGSVDEWRNDKDRYSVMYIPLAGPWIAIGTIKPIASAGFGLGLLGVGQAAGVAMFIGGLAFPKSRLVRNDIGKTEGKPQHFSVKFAPVMTPTSGGLGLAGTW